MPPKQIQCKFFTSHTGCRAGDHCRFTHTPLTLHTPDDTPSPWQIRGSNKSPSNIPRNTCQFFWETGACVRGFECVYRHTKQTNETTVQAVEVTAADGGDAVADFFSLEGLAIGTGSLHEDRFNLNPSEVHNHLKEFGGSDHFRNATQAQGFVRILASVNDRNKAWNTENAQEFLEAVVKGNALHRIGDILRFEGVDVSTGHRTGTLSFQKGYLPLFQFFSSNLVLKSTLHKNINILYAIIKDNHDHIFATLRACLGTMMAAKSWKDHTPNLASSLQNTLDGLTIFRTLTTIFLQYFQRYKDVIRSHSGVSTFIQQFSEWFSTWASDVSATPARFEDTITSAPAKNRKLTIDHISGEIDRLLKIVERESDTVLRLSKGLAKLTITHVQRSQARSAQLQQIYDPPGELRVDGRRHDNDFAAIEKIRIAPTHSEFFSPVAPYMPVFDFDAPHHLPAGSMERHLDIQFRLLREELISTTRASVNAIHDDLLKIWEAKWQRIEMTKLEKILEQKGGAYRTSGRDSLFFQVYTDVEFIAKPPEVNRSEVVVTLVIDAPPIGAARDEDAKKRFAYWEHSRRLQGSSLVVLIVVSGHTVQAYLGVILSFGKSIAESSKYDNRRIQLRVSFFESEVELMALRGEPLNFSRDKFAVLVDNGVMFEAVKPFLQKIQTTEPTEIPFSRYIAAGGSLEAVDIPPPKYARAPDFKFNLQCLAKPGTTFTVNKLDVLNTLAVARARDQLKKFSVLDPSQVDAVIDTLTREVSLIQGPPGTGKSYTAKEILHVLFSSNIKPVVLIAYTNHALDHMVSSVLDAKITEKIVRLGSRSSDERISEYTLSKLERLATAPTLDRSMKRQYSVMKRLEETLTETMTSIRLPLLSWDEIEKYLNIHYPEHADRFMGPPFWIARLVEMKQEEEEKLGEFTQVTYRKKSTSAVQSSVSKTIYGFWRQGLDIEFIRQKPSTPLQTEKGDSDTTKMPQSLLTNPEAFFTALGFEGQIPLVPSGDRKLTELLVFANVWSMSASERLKLADQWERRIRKLAYDSQLDQYTRLKQEYKEACKEYNDMRDEIRRRILRSTDLIACTTTGAASVTSLLNSIEPKVLMVEEAGQVLEAHILASLVPSIHQLICIGDPCQLRPSLATYSALNLFESGNEKWNSEMFQALSSESAIGRELYKFDRSLMERLSDAGFPMSQINVQRRMRSEISHFIRTILYPKLVDHEYVLDYPAVKGMQKDVFFFNHLHKEKGSEDSVSKSNIFEVKMIRDLVMYFLRQGSYDGPGDIAILCAYLGQLQQVRAALRDLKIAVAVNEKDAEQLARQGIEEDVEYEEVNVAKHVRLGTVDIFQGQEAKIVIVSLVRNSGQIDTGSTSIGFLKSPNRINVALSRAKHGLFILGNAANLRQNPTWSMILDEMEARDQVGPAFPIVCPRHPKQARLISQPGEIPLHAPNGGCVLPCDARLLCGHICPSVCHAVLDNHRNTKCEAPCNRTPCPRKHPCSRRCSDECGKCHFPMYQISLPCGHVAAKVPCYMLEDLTSVKCLKQVSKQLPRCEHIAIMGCYKDPSTVKCSEPCAEPLDCCTKSCKSTCSQCQSLTSQNKDLLPSGRILRCRHAAHPCERLLYCEHKCNLNCHPKDQNCNVSCRQACRQQCVHHRCPKPCSEPCSPCMEPCTWSCVHMACPVVCGSICSRLPCDEPCRKILECGHPCPSVCGEICAMQKCVVCLSEEDKIDIVDFIMQRSLTDIDLASSEVSDRLITLACGHIFTVETLDGHCNMSAFYQIDELGRFISTKSPPVNYQTPPTCPTCRGPITALRYGRVTKRATLDILEQNVAGTMSHSLEECSPGITEFTCAMSTHEEQVKALKSQSTKASLSRQNPDEMPLGDVHGPLPANFLDSEGMQKVHGIGLEEARAWYKIIKPIVKIYRRVLKIAIMRGAHVKAYEAAFATLFRLELQAIADAPEREFDDAPESLAFAIVKQKIGQPHPKADVRFQIEAYFLSLEIRALIAQLAQTRVEALPLTSTAKDTDVDVVYCRRQWASLVTFLYQSCVKDAEKAIALATESSAFRQVARAYVHKLRFNFESFRWRTMMQRSEMFRMGLNDSSVQKQLSENVGNYKLLLRQGFNLIQKTYLQNIPSLSTLAEYREERKWLNENCGRKVDAWEKECDKLEHSVMNGVLYQPILTQELEDIVRSFGFSHRGHFYNCQNGHTFVITECGGAMERARCPECKAPIGGSSHELDSSNTRNMELERIAREQGSADSPWSWNGNA